jgi:AcrR family transcriptional regulator
MTKADIIRAAFRIWGRGLYQTTSLTQLARELGVSKPALYRHFKNKQALLDGMYACFFDEYTACIKAGYERALTAENKKEGFLAMSQALADYYCKNVYAFVFSLFQVYGCREHDNVLAELTVRGIDLRLFISRCEEPGVYPPKIQMLAATVTFWLAHFHKNAGSFEKTPSNHQIEAVLASLEQKLAGGLGLNRERIDAIDYEALEQAVLREGFAAAENDELLRAVAGAVAEAGPWNASMDMVAQRSGLSKSGLYAHFKSRRDMLSRFFLTEFDRILAYIEANVCKSAAPEEQLYLVILSIANYFRIRPEFMAALDWLRTRRIDLGLTPPLRLYTVFSDIKLEAFKPQGDIMELSPDWIMFMSINTLMRYRDEKNLSEIPDNCFRVLFRFITLGLGGFDP